MVKRKLATVTASLALLIPAGAFALGLGNISMNSALDQRLKAEIPIQSATTEDLEGLEVNLASDAMFAQYGIERPEFLDGLQFEILKGAEGKSYIQLSSSKPIREPFLNFLVEAKWPSGHALRQFTVLVDPPTMMAAVPVKVAPARASAPMRERLVAAGASQSLLSTDNRTGAIEYGPSQANDTLWGVARAMRGNHDVSVHQVMLAILRDNPDAFYRNNVNNLKMGYVLRINDPASLTLISRVEAEREISRQYQNWKNDRTGSSAAAPAVAESSVNAQSATGSAGESAVVSQVESAQLKLTSAGKTDQPQAQGEATSAAMDDVNERLAIANEQLLANNQETTALTERLGKLEGQLESLQRLVQLKDNQLAEIQQRAKEAPAAAAAPVTQAEPVAEGLFDSPLALGLIALVVGLIAALGYMLFQRRQQAEYQESILDQSAAPVSEIPAGAATKTSAVASSSVEQNDSESSLLTDFSTTSMEGLQSDIGEIDPISEADVYLAYGRYTQAEEIIENALKNDADREEYHTKLLEIYHAADEKEKFLGAAQRYHGVLGGNLLGDGWVKVCAMGRELQPDNALFVGDGTVTDHDVTESSQALNEMETSESELTDSLSSEDRHSELEMPTDEIPQDELDGFDFKALDEKLDQLDQLDERSLNDPFSESESDSPMIEESKTLDDNNSLEFDSGSLEALNAENSSGGESENQQIDDDIASNTLDFGVSDVTEKTADELSATDDEASAVEPLDDDTVDTTTDEALTTTENDDFGFTSAKDEATAELNLDADTDADTTEETQKTDADSFDFEDLEDLESENKPTETDADVESNLLGVANALDETADVEPEARKDDGLESVDLGSMTDLTDDNSDYDYDDNPFSDLDEVGTKLDLARAYVDMGDKEGAQSIIDEVMQEGTDEQKEEAQKLLEQL
ncbi:hypothetical protein MNBD_GAMMA18-2184 [hydrothermal vent metagenome]|uniref:FimV N-terminal domain-containing protein n=1 Tax=hydrothermal vent metagenome TaxID=652676 RepID=A0A3B0ZNJ9_9ZZZZ